MSQEPRFVARHLKPATTHKTYTLRNFREIPQIAHLDEQQRFDIEVVGRILPFRANNFIVDELINWDKAPDDPMFILTFPRREMLLPEHYETIARLLRTGADETQIKAAATDIRMQLNPHPAGQMEHNVPTYQGMRLHGMQHKYRQTVLFFPSQGQTCHAYCSFCFRWPQFTDLPDFKFARRETNTLLAYLREHPEVNDVLFTGGDPLVMSAKNLAAYIEPLLQSDLSHIRRIRIGTKTLTYWPYRFLSDTDTGDLLKLFRKVVDSGKHLALMSHLNHPRELEPEATRHAIVRLRETGAVIRTQSPLLRHINDDPSGWSTLWNKQVDLGCVPYYMFVSRDTGAQHYFSVPLVRAWKIFREAYQNVSGLARTVRGPSMSATPGKVQILGPAEMMGQQVIALSFLQGRHSGWVDQPFFAEYDDQAAWLDQLKPAFGQKRFFFEEDAAAWSVNV